MNMKRISVLRFLFLILALTLVAGCSLSRSGNNTTTRGNVIGVPNVISIVTVTQLDAMTEAVDLQTLTGTAKCDVTVVQINYQTIGVQPGEMTNASAALLIPSGVGCKGPFPLVAYGRGTNAFKAHTMANPED
ncbi:MAG: esterase, partial [Deltaproteobacteria bacterium HGW-Deltaproteobacteria-1]